MMSSKGYKNDIKSFRGLIVFFFWKIAKIAKKKGMEVWFCVEHIVEVNFVSSTV